MKPREYREARIAAGLSQNALAQALGVDREIVNRREQGKAPIKLEQVLALSIVLEQAVPPSEISQKPPHENNY